MADGVTATDIAKLYPTLEFDIVTVAGQNNTVGMPIYLQSLDILNRVCVTDTTGGTLSIPGSPGFTLTIKPGSATFPGGSKTGCVSATPVNIDKIPMSPGFGQQPRYVVTIQPVGTTFNPPMAMTMPNVDGLAPRAKTEMYSYDHDLAAFVAIGSATVSADGSVISSDPGIGVMKAGWHCGGNPNTTGSAGTCPDCNKCQGSGCNADAGQDGRQCAGDICKECKGGGCVTKQVTVTITAPPNNPTPSDSTFDTNFSFLSETAIDAQASLSPSGDTSKIEWSVTGTVKNETPANRKGASFSFTPNPLAHPTYGTAGSYGRSSALTYQLVANYCVMPSTSTTVTQDQKDIIRQEYLNHSLGDPGRAGLQTPQITTNFSIGEVNNTAYSVILGQPGVVGQAVRNTYNNMIYDDVQALAVGTIGLLPTAVVVSPGANVHTIGAVLNTTPCYPAAANSCDDVVVGNSIAAGPNGIAETTARNERTNFGLTLTSGWRNPERNEAVGGVRTSRHQFGNAVDLIPGVVPSLTTAQLYCILETAASTVGQAISEIPASNVPQPCNLLEIDHVHVEQ